MALTPDGVREMEAARGRGARPGGRRRGREHPRRGVQGGRRRDRWRCSRGVGQGRDGREGEGTAGLRVRAPSPRPHALHLPAPGRVPEGGAGVVRRRHHRHRLRDGDARRRRPPAARSDERGGRPARRPGRCPLPRGAAGRARRAPRWRARRAAGPRRRDRCGQRRVELGVDRRGHGSGGEPPRQEPRPPSLRRPDPQGPDHNPGVEPRHRRALHRGGRPRDRRRAGRRRSCAGGDHRADGGHHEAGCGDRRRGHRPGRLRGDVTRDHPPRPHLRGARRRPLLRRQHAGRGARDLHPCAHERHAPLPRGGGGARRHRGMPQGSRAGPRAEHRGRPGGERGGGRGARACRPARRAMASR